MNLPLTNPHPDPHPGPPPFQEQKWGRGNPLPTGTVTFLFTDIQGSTSLWESHAEPMAEALQIHNAVLRQAIEANGGAVFKIVGDAFQAAYEKGQTMTFEQALAYALES
jgi:class 3 adenylate cyclase